PFINWKNWYLYCTTNLLHLSTARLRDFHCFCLYRSDDDFIIRHRLENPIVSSNWKYCSNWVKFNVDVNLPELAEKVIGIKPYQIERIETWFTPEVQDSNDTYQIDLSMLAVGSGK